MIKILSWLHSKETRIGSEVRDPVTIVQVVCFLLIHYLQKILKLYLQIKKKVKIELLVK